LKLINEFATSFTHISHVAVKSHSCVFIYMILNENFLFVS